MPGRSCVPFFLPFLLPLLDGGGSLSGAAYTAVTTGPAASATEKRPSVKSLAYFFMQFSCSRRAINGLAPGGLSRDHAGQKIRRRCGTSDSIYPTPGPEPLNIPAIGIFPAASPQFACV